MTPQTGGGGILRIHHPQHRLTVEHRGFAVRLSLGMARIGENPEYFRLEIVRPVARKPIICARQLYANPGFAIEALSGLAGKDGGDDAFKSDSLLIDDR